VKSNQDIWSQWLLHRRFADDPKRMQAMLEYLYPVRDKVLSHANLAEHETLLDVGCGDGLIAIGALEKVTAGKVIFSDISQDLLDRAQSISQEMGVINKCQFLYASADDLSLLDDASVDVITTRSVLIYVSAKQKAFNEFYRVLKSKGRLSIFEPINRFAYPEAPHLFFGYDVTPVLEIAQKVKIVYLQLQPPDSDPMLDFDEGDLISFAERAGFGVIHLELQVEIKPHDENVTWESFLRAAWNPKIPTLEEATQQALTPDEAEGFLAYLRPQVEAKNGISRSAVAYLWATKP
jgi:SAM-dependent methyltransferase